MLKGRHGHSKVSPLTPYTTLYTIDRSNLSPSKLLSPHSCGSFDNVGGKEEKGDIAEVCEEVFESRPQTRGKGRKGGEYIYWCCPKEDTTSPIIPSLLSFITSNLFHTLHPPPTHLSLCLVDAGSCSYNLLSSPLVFQSTSNISLNSSPAPVIYPSSLPSPNSATLAW